ncbi:hypothetical protein BGS_0901 [Beggiatoa sp. SS]|nr:hypothetical protein BGS_0901 [Beggiatoa sp. SS]
MFLQALGKAQGSYLLINLAPAAFQPVNNPNPNPVPNQLGPIVLLPPN